ncbi:MAG TPA: universal stress protein [Caldilineaceae bacterium]|nr:universal stress protein [Caldilineaceae bacterium]
MSIPYRKILLPLDGSEIAAQALPYAQDLAEHSGAELILYHVIPEPRQMVLSLPEGRWAQPAAEQHTQLPDQSGDQLQGLADELALHHVTARVILDVGEPAAKIIDYAASHDIDLIVMSSHGRTGLARWTHGSVAAKVIGGARCPLLLVRAELGPR